MATDTRKANVHTVYLDGAWANRSEGAERVNRKFDNKTEALEAGKATAIKRGVEHIIHGKDGEIQKSKSYAK